MTAEDKRDARALTKIIFNGVMDTVYLAEDLSDARTKLREFFSQLVDKLEEGL